MLLFEAIARFPEVENKSNEHRKLPEVVQHLDERPAAESVSKPRQRPLDDECRKQPPRFLVEEVVDSLGAFATLDCHRRRCPFRAWSAAAYQPTAAFRDRSRRRRKGYTGVNSRHATCGHSPASLKSPFAKEDVMAPLNVG